MTTNRLKITRYVESTLLTGPLTGYALLLARIGWLAVLVLSTVVGFASFRLAAQVDLLYTLPEVAGEVDIALYRVFANNQFLSNTQLHLVALAQLAAFLIVGLLLFWRRSRDWLAIMTSAMLVATGVGFSPGAFLLPILRPAWWLPMTLLQIILFSLLVVFLFIFPDGRVVPARARWLVGAWVIYACSWLIFPQLNPHQTHSPIALFAFIAVVLLGTAAQLYRYRFDSNRIQRQQSKWVMVGFVTTNLCFFTIVSTSVLGITPRLEAIAPRAVQFTNAVFGLTAILIPITIGFAILRYRLWDIDLFINRALVYGGLTALVIGIYILVVGGLGTLLQTTNNFVLSVLATGVIAVLFQPIRERLQQAVNRLMYGNRDDPFALLTSLGSRLEQTGALEEQLSQLTATIATALKLPYVAVVAQEAGQQEVMAEHGQPVERVYRFPLISQSQGVGHLLVAPRAPREPLTANERDLLAMIAGQVGAVVHTVQLASSLQHSREQLVLAQEEERRRLQRDLHDGLGPQLASLSMRLEVAQQLVTSDPEAAADLLMALKQESQAAIGDIRRLVYALRPPVLDQLGLSGAIHEFLANSRTPGGPELRADIPTDLPELPAAVETAAYRIITEAVANSLHHASATHGHVRLRMDDGLHIVIADDGCGLPEPYAPGVGMSSIRQRATELGGWVTFRRRASGGTSVELLLPIPAAGRSDK